VKKLRENTAAIIWAMKLAMRINAKIFLGWSFISIMLSILPAIALFYNREAVSILSNFIASGYGEFADVLPSILVLGVILTVIGLSRRVNKDFLNMQLHDTYYFGFQEFYMDTVQDIELKTLMDKKYLDTHYSSLGRCGSLSDFMTAFVVLLSKFVGAGSLLIVAAQVSSVIFFAAVGYIAAIMLLNFLMADKLRWNHQTYDEAARLSGYYQNSVMSPGVAKELRVYDLAEETIQKWEKAYQRIIEVHKRYDAIRPFFSAVTGLGFYIFIAGMMAYSIFQVAAGNMGVDVFLMLYAMGQSISEVAGNISGGFRSADNALFFLKIQRNFVKSVPKVPKDQKSGFEPADKINVFTAKNMSFSYDDEKEVLRNLNFTIKKGETVALVGLNGSGKSTLVKLLIGLFSPTKGELTFYGKSYDEKTRGGVIKRVGMFFQDFHIFHATFRENIGFGDLKSLSDEQKILRAVEIGNAAKILSNMENGLEQWLNKHVRKDGVWLSGGENQRIAISRTHMSDKEILIFDEPASALDPIAEMKQFQSIREKIQGATAILISHRVGFARLADRILVLNNGELAEDGTHEELLKNGGIYANFFNEQAQWYEG